MAARRQGLTHQTALARGDTDAFAERSVNVTHMLGGDLAAIQSKISLSSLTASA